MLRRVGLQGWAALRSYAATAEGGLAARAALLAPRWPVAITRPPVDVEERMEYGDGSMPELVVSQGELSLPADQGSSSSSLWEDLWDGLLWAVPKKKASHRRQRRRLVRYDVDNVTHTHPCPACGKIKVRHRLCEKYEQCATVHLNKHRAGAGPEPQAGVKEDSKA